MLHLVTMAILHLRHCSIICFPQWELILLSLVSNFTVFLLHLSTSHNVAVWCGGWGAREYSLIVRSLLIMGFAEHANILKTTIVLDTVPPHKLNTF